MSGEHYDFYLGADTTQMVPALVMAATLRRPPAGPLIRIHFLQADLGRLLRLEGRELVDAGPLPLRPEERPGRSGTRFSLARFAIPEIQGWRGRAVYCDSDQLCLADPRELADFPLGAGSLAACASRRPGSAPGAIDTSVMTIDCARCPWRIQEILQGIAAERWTYWEVMTLDGPAAALRHAGVSLLDPAWNTFDVPGEATRLLHYTTRELQPWKNDDLPSPEARALWESELARAARELPELPGLVRLGVENGFLKASLLALL